MSIANITDLSYWQLPSYVVRVIDTIRDGPRWAPLKEIFGAAMPKKPKGFTLDSSQAFDVYLDMIMERGADDVSRQNIRNWALAQEELDIEVLLRTLTVLLPKKVSRVRYEQALAETFPLEVPAIAIRVVQPLYDPGVLLEDSFVPSRHAFLYEPTQIETTLRVEHPHASLLRHLLQSGPIMVRSAYHELFSDTLTMVRGHNSP